MIKSSNHSKNTFSPQVQKQINAILSRVSNFVNEANTILEEHKPPPIPREPAQVLEQLFLRFHTVAKQLQKRQRGRQPFDVKDEYDVQDLLNGLLQMFFVDVRPEEYCPSYAGTSPRMDFFLKEEQIAIEAKMASETHRKKKIAEELILDKEYYSKKAGVRFLYCLVYDPNEIITNPHGFESDLNEKTAKFEVKVFVVPRKT